MARLTSSPENPIPVREVAQKIGAWIARLGEIWVDGQIAQLTRRPGVATQFLTLRDPDSTISLTVTCGRGVLPDTVAIKSKPALGTRYSRISYPVSLCDSSTQFSVSVVTLDGSTKASYGGSRCVVIETVFD